MGCHVLQLGRGNLLTDADDEMDLKTLGENIAHSPEELQTKIYPDLEENYKKRIWLRDLILML